MTLLATVTHPASAHSCKVALHPPNIHGGLWTAKERDMEKVCNHLGTSHLNMLQADVSFIVRDEGGWPVQVIYAQ
jgi:hypothetical protein